MSDQYDWDSAGADDAKLTIRAAVHYLLKGTAGVATAAWGLQTGPCPHKCRKAGGL